MHLKLITDLCSISLQTSSFNQKNFMTYEISAQKNKNNNSVLLFICMLILTTAGNAQDVLVGLTSNGGPEGRGTAFALKTSGTNFTILKGFADWGKEPNGSFLPGDDGGYVCADAHGYRQPHQHSRL